MAIENSRLQPCMHNALFASAAKHYITSNKHRWHLLETQYLLPLPLH